MRHSFTPASYLAALCACSSLGFPSEPLPPDGEVTIRLTTDKLTYSPAAPAQLELLNQSPDTVLFGGCDDVLEHRLATGDWISLRRSPHPCPALALVLLPGVPMTLSFDLRPATTPGRYRLRRAFFSQRIGSEGTFYRRSNEFQVSH